MVDTTFKLCDWWITDTSCVNKHLLNTTNGGNPVHLSPLMLHFTKDEKAFCRFGLEVLSAKPNLKNISFIGLDLESAISTGLKTMILGLRRLNERCASCGETRRIKKSRFSTKNRSKHLWQKTFFVRNNKSYLGIKSFTKLVFLEPKWTKLKPSWGQTSTPIWIYFRIDGNHFA